MKIALAQINVTVGDLAGNQAKIVQAIERAKKANAHLVAFPELVITGYPPEDLLHKPHFIQDNLAVLKNIVKTVTGIAVVLGFVDRDKKGFLYNSAAIIENKKIKHVYHKQRLPNYGVFDEKRYFKKGKSVKVVTINKTKIAVNVCEDIWGDHDVCEEQAKKGAKVILNISCSPYDSAKYEQRLALLQKRAKQTKTYFCYVNVVGGQDELVFDGGSMVVDPQGNILASGKQFEEDMVVQDVPFKGKSSSRAKPLPRVESIYRALVLGTRDYITKNGFKKVCVGLSGGIDSALVAALSVAAVGKDNVVGVTMPSRYNSQETLLDAKQVAKNLGIEIIEIPIEHIFNAYMTSLAALFAPTNPNIAEENIQARIRGSLLMALSNKFGWLVLTTGNKSEIAVGYCTLYGDMVGGFAVIKDVTKSQVYALARFINQNQPGVIPPTTINRDPSAELRPDQKDQDSLPPYDELDKALEAYVEAHHSYKQMCKKQKEGIVKDVIRMVDQSEYKRRQAPPGIKITQRAFGKDWRLPITNKYKES